MGIDCHLDVSLFPKELKLLLSLIGREDTTSSLFHSQEQLADINWERFLKLTQHHRVYPVLSAKLQKTKPAWIPLYVIEALHKGYHWNTFQMLHLSAEMEHVSKLFAASQIQILILKGPILAADLYGDISLRTSGDLDILLPLEDLKYAQALLEDLGYVQDDYIQTVLNDWKWRHHHITFFHPNKKIKLEIHWRLGPGPGKEPSFHDLWERKRISTMTNNPIYYLGREDLFLFLASHGARHGWSRLRWLVDMDRMVQQPIDWTKLIRLLAQYNQLHIGAQALVLVSQLLNVPLTAEMQAISERKRGKRLAQDALFYIRQMVNLHSYPIPIEVSRYHKHHLFSLMSYQHKMLFILSFLYPYPEDADTLPLPHRLHFLYFVLRPLLWAWRKTKKNVVSKEGT